MRLLIESIIRLILTVFVSCSIIFFAIRILPGSAEQRLMGMDGGEVLIPSESPYEDTHLFRAYWFWMGSLISFDFSPTLYANRDVASIVLPAMRNSLVLIGMSFITSLFLCAVLLLIRPLGVILTAILLAPPRFIIALTLSFILSDWLKVLPVWSMNIFLQAAIPFITITLAGATMLFQYIEQRIELENKRDYVQTARAFGASSVCIYWKHILPVVLPGILLYSGSILSILFGIATILERMFAVSGIGNVLINAILVKDFPLIQASASILISVVVILLNISLYFSKSLIQRRTGAQTVENL